MRNFSTILNDVFITLWKECFHAPYEHFPGGIEENHDKPYSECQIYRTRFDAGVSRIRITVQWHSAKVLLDVCDVSV